MDKHHILVALFLLGISGLTLGQGKYTPLGDSEEERETVEKENEEELESRYNQLADVQYSAPFWRDFIPEPVRRQLGDEVDDDDDDEDENTEDKPFWQKILERLAKERDERIQEWEKRREKWNKEREEREKEREKVREQIKKEREEKRKQREKEREERERRRKEKREKEREQRKKEYEQMEKECEEKFPDSKPHRSRNHCKIVCVKRGSYFRSQYKTFNRDDGLTCGRSKVCKHGRCVRQEPTTPSPEVTTTKDIYTTKSIPASTKEDDSDTSHTTRESYSTTPRSETTEDSYRTTSKSGTTEDSYRTTPKSETTEDSYRTTSKSGTTEDSHETKPKAETTEDSYRPTTRESVKTSTYSALITEQTTSQHTEVATRDSKRRKIEEDHVQTAEPSAIPQQTTTIRQSDHEEGKSDRREDTETSSIAIDPRNGDATKDQHDITGTSKVDTTTRLPERGERDTGTTEKDREYGRQTESTRIPEYVEASGETVRDRILD